MPKIIQESRFIAYLHRSSRAKRVLISLSILASISLAGYFFYVRPLQNNLNETTLNIAMLKKQNTALRSAISKHKQVDIQDVYKTSWSLEDAGTVEMLNFFQRHGLVCESLQDGAMRKTGPPPRTLTLAGSFQQLYEAMIALESVQCNVLIDRFAIKTVNQNNIQVTFSMRDSHATV